MANAKLEDTKKRLMRRSEVSEEAKKSDIIWTTNAL